MRGGTASQVSRGAGFVEGAYFPSPTRGEGKLQRCAPYSDIGLSEMSQSLPVNVEMKSVFIGV